MYGIPIDKKNIYWVVQKKKEIYLWNTSHYIVLFEGFDFGMNVNRMNFSTQHNE